MPIPLWAPYGIGPRKESKVPQKRSSPKCFALLDGLRCDEAMLSRPKLLAALLRMLPRPLAALEVGGSVVGIVDARIEPLPCSDLSRGSEQVLVAATADPAGTFGPGR